MISGTAQQRTYSVTDVARIFGVTPSHVWRLCQRGDLPSIRLGGRILIPRDAVDRILAAANTDEARGGR
jgi:excisionase family DNA binding protein